MSDNIAFREATYRKGSCAGCRDSTSMPQAERRSQGRKVSAFLGQLPSSLSSRRSPVFCANASVNRLTTGFLPSTHRVVLAKRAIVTLGCLVAAEKEKTPEGLICQWVVCEVPLETPEWAWLLSGWIAWLRGIGRRRRGDRVST